MTVEAVAGMFTVGAILVGAGNRIQKTSATEGHAIWVKYWTYAGIVGGIMVCALERALLVTVLTIAAVQCVREALRVRAYTAAIWVLASLGFALLTRNFLALYLVVAAADAFAELGGRLLCGPRLCPQLSPGKRVSGAFCGIAAAIGMGFLLGLRLDVALILAIAGQAGDLAASKIKRRAGIKDFGDALPGYGGFLDRFDSLWGAALLGAFLC